MKAHAITQTNGVFKEKSTPLVGKILYPEKLAETTDPIVWAIEYHERHALKCFYAKRFHKQEKFMGMSWETSS